MEERQYFRDIMWQESCYFYGVFNYFVFEAICFICCFFMILNFATGVFFVVWLALLNFNNNPTQESTFAENKFLI